MNRDENVWGYSSSGVKGHAFIEPWADQNGVVHPDFKRAVCRSTIARHAGAPFYPKGAMVSVCGHCEKKLNAAYDRMAQAAEETGRVIEGTPVIEDDHKEALAANETLDADLKRDTRAVSVGDVFDRTHTRYPHGYPEQYTITARVTDVFEGYTDPWTRKKSPTGVRFVLGDEYGAAYYSLSLDDFVAAWVDKSV